MPGQDARRRCFCSPAAVLDWRDRAAIAPCCRLRRRRDIGSVLPLKLRKSASMTQLAWALLKRHRARISIPMRIFRPFYDYGAAATENRLSKCSGRPLLAACGENGRSANSGTGDEFPRREATENNPPVAAETSCLSRNCPSNYFCHRPLGLCGRRLPELNLIPIQVIDPGKATVGFIHSFGVNLYSLLF